MERPPLAGANAKPNAPRVRTVGFSVYGEQREEEPEAGGAEDTSPLPVMIPPAFQVRPARARGARCGGVVSTLGSATAKRCVRTRLARVASTLTRRDAAWRPQAEVRA